MGRKKLFACDINFDEEQPIKAKLLSMFSTNNIVNCFNENNVDSYSEIYEYPNVKMLFKDDELINTINSFYDNSLNITLTAKAMFLHRNTLNYRLDKIKKIIGFDIRKFEDAVTIHNLIVIHDMLY